MALKTEAMGLAIMVELPLIICDIQRGGPSTGLPTKTEQADLAASYVRTQFGSAHSRPCAFHSWRLLLDCRGSRTHRAEVYGSL